MDTRNGCRSIFRYDVSEMRATTKAEVRARRELRSIVLAGLLALAACGPAPPPEARPAAGEWQEFQGTWTAAGTRNTIGLGADRRASIASFEGSLLVAGPTRPGVGFRADALVFNDSAAGMVGRAVWTDERGDEIYSEMRGEVTATRSLIAGTFLGGTGRYAGATGGYEFSWRFLLEAEDGTVQGQTLGLKGRVRVPSPQATSGAGGPRP